MKQVLLFYRRGTETERTVSSRATQLYSQQHRMQFVRCPTVQLLAARTGLEPVLFLAHEAHLFSKGSSPYALCAVCVFVSVCVTVHSRLDLPLNHMMNIIFGVIL